MRLTVVFGLVASLLVIGCGNKTMAGRYRIEQHGTGFGTGMDQLALDLKDDKTYVITAGQAQWFVGTWTFNGDLLELSSSDNNLGTTFRAWKGKLYPFANGKEVPGWCWVR
jgi:hypothetical protein